MSNLRTTISRLASDFAHEVLDAIRRASLDEILDETGRGGRARSIALAEDGSRRRGPGRPPGKGRVGRLRRRSAADLARLADEIVELLEKHPEGLRAEQIRDALDVQAKELPRPLADALSERKISKKGQKRATTYFSKGNGGANPAASKRSGRGARSAKKSAPGRGKRGRKAGSAKAAGAAVSNGATASA